MFVNTNQLQLAINNFIDLEMGKKAVGFNKFASYLIIPFAEKKVAKLMQTFSKNELTKDMFDENGNVNIDEVYSMAKTAIKKSGQFEAYGMIFSETDFDKLYSYIKQVGGSV